MKTVAGALFCVALYAALPVSAFHSMQVVAPKHNCQCVDDMMLCLLTDGASFGFKDICNARATHLLLSGNSNTSLPADAFKGLTRLQWLLLTRNKMTTLPPGLLKQLRNLQNISLSKNQLEELPDGLFSKLDNLQNIDLSSNLLRRMSESLFSGLRSLKFLSLFRNQLMTLPPKIFRGLVGLEKLNLSENQLEYLPNGLFRDLRNLKLLVLSSNKLTSIKGKDLVGLQSLQSLRVDNNRLTMLPTLDSSWPSVGKAFYFQGNPIKEDSVTERVVLSWLSSAPRVLLLSTPALGPFLHPEGLHWAVVGDGIEAVVGAECSCGALRSGGAEMRFCTQLQCGQRAKLKDWLAAARANGTNKMLF